MASLSQSNLPPEEIPAMPPPPGVTSNFVNPESRGYQVYISSAVCLALVIPFMVIRLYTRIRITHNFGWDDGLAILTTILLLPTIGINCYQTTYYLGRHTWDVRLVDVLWSWQQQNTAWYICHVLASCFVRLSLLTLFLRIFDIVKSMKAIIYATMAFVIAYNLGTVVSWMLVYGHPIDTGNAEEELSVLNKMVNITIITSALNIFVDLLLLIIPLHPLSRLRLSRRSKFRVSLVFFTGSLAVVAAVISIAFRVTFVHRSDYSWNTVAINITSFVENSVGIICSCMPLVARFIRQLNQKEVPPFSHEPFCYQIYGTGDTRGGSSRTAAGSVPSARFGLKGAGSDIDEEHAYKSSVCGDSNESTKESSGNEA